MQDPAHRGSNLAASTWTLICERLREAGNRVLITPVATDNAPARGAVEKAGFIGSEIVDYRKRGFAERVTVEPLDEDLTDAERTAAAQIAAALEP